MTSLYIALRRGLALIGAGGMVLAVAAGCAGPTTLTVEQGEGPYNVQILMDPATLNPPQLATLNFRVAERDSGTAVTEFEELYGAVLHNVLISKDLQHFQHSYTGIVGPDGPSVLTNFPVTGEYFSHGFFRPKDAEPQHVRAEIASGTAEMVPVLVASSDVPRFSQGVQHDLVLGPEPLRAGQPAQLALYISEKGQAVTTLDPFLDGPGLMFVSSSDGTYFEIEEGSSPSHVTSPPGSATAGTTATAGGTVTAAGTPTRSGSARAGATATSVATRPASGSTPQSQQESSQQPASAGATEQPEPTLMPEVADGLATVAAQPAPTLAPVQLTAMTSVLETPAVVPSVAYGPYVAFSHIFPEPGLYKLWFKTSYRQRAMVVDFVVRVE